MEYEYKKLNIKSYLSSLYSKGFKKSNNFKDEDLENLILNIGIFKFKGYVKAFREKKYLENKNLIELKSNINYPPFHYFIEDITLGAFIGIVSKLRLDNQNLLKLLANRFNIYNKDVFLNYLLRLKELRNRCAHSGRLFNRNYHSVKAFGNHKDFRKIIYEHKLIDVYYTLHSLLNEKKFKDVYELINDFEKHIIIDCDKETKDFIMRVIKKQGKCASSDLP